MKCANTIPFGPLMHSQDNRYQEQSSLDFYQENLQNFSPQNRPDREINKRKTDAYITENGEYLYRLRQRNPHGYGRRRREVGDKDKILIRVPRSA